MTYYIIFYVLFRRIRKYQFRYKEREKAFCWFLCSNAVSLPNRF